MVISDKKYKKLIDEYYEKGVVPDVKEEFRKEDKRMKKLDPSF